MEHGLLSQKTVEGMRFMRGRALSLELVWALFVLIANFLLFASHSWALGSGLPSMSSQQAVVQCAYFDGKEQDATAFATEQSCHAAHDQCVRTCTISMYSCVAQGALADGKSCRQAGISEISEADARSRALASCLASGAVGCEVVQKCSEQKREVIPPEQRG